MESPAAAVASLVSACLKLEPVPLRFNTHREPELIVRGGFLNAPLFECGFADMHNFYVDPDLIVFFNTSSS